MRGAVEDMAELGHRMRPRVLKPSGAAPELDLRGGLQETVMPPTRAEIVDPIPAAFRAKQGHAQAVLGLGSDRLPCGGR